MNIWLLFTLIVELSQDVWHICTQQLSSRDAKPICKTPKFRVKFRTMPNIYVGAFCANIVFVFHASTIFAKSSIIDIWHGLHYTLRKFILHIVDLFKLDCNFLTKFWHSNQMFRRNIFRLVYLKFELSPQAQFAITRYYIVFKYFLTWYQLDTFTVDVLCLTHFMPLIQRFSDVFRGYQKRSVAWNELMGSNNNDMNTWSLNYLRKRNLR